MKSFLAISFKLCTALLVVALMGSFSCLAAEDDLDSSRLRLDKIQKQIEKTLAGLRSKETESGALSEDLENLDREVRRIARQKKKSDQELVKLTENLVDKRKFLQQLEVKLTKTEEQIHKRLIVLYKTGEVGLIKALISESASPVEIAEKYAFLSRMVRRDRELLLKYRNQTHEHEKGIAELEKLHEKQSQLVLQREQEQQVLNRARQAKKNLLATVNKDAGLLKKMLDELRAKAARLNDLVKKLETEQTQPYTGNLDGLEAYKGRLLWPVSGQLRVGFGTNRDRELGTLIESRGYEIEAEVGTTVSAAAKGKIIFANSLRGYGKLMILDHGNKYYSLYAHIARFTKQVGDTVSAADVIAFSGFEGRDTIYFEIRKGGKPLDPGEWLKPR